MYFGYPYIVCVCVCVKGVEKLSKSQENKYSCSKDSSYIIKMKYVLLNRERFSGNKVTDLKIIFCVYKTKVTKVR